MNSILEEVSEEQKHVLGNLLEFYVYEFTAYLDIELNEEGRYGFKDLDLYISSEEFFPYFIKVNGNLAGFAIVKKHRSADFDYSMEQFFVMKKYNRRGVGQEGAKLAFETFKGRWRITQTEKNYPAQAFWRKVIKQYTGNTHEEFYDQDRRSVQSFSNL